MAGQRKSGGGMVLSPPSNMEVWLSWDLQLIVPFRFLFLLCHHIEVEPRTLCVRVGVYPRVLLMVLQYDTWEVPGSPLRISLHINRCSFLSAPCKCVLAFSSVAKCCTGAYES